MATTAEMRKHFADHGATAPPALEALVTFAAAADDYFSGGFEVALDDAAAWFDGDRVAARQFVPFGSSADGGMYAYWRYDGRPADAAPVVYLGSEGEVGVVANSTNDFLRLLTVGAGELGTAAIQGVIEPDDDPAPGLDAFRRWLRDERGLVPPDDPVGLVEAAQAAHPDLADWVGGWQRRRSGTPSPPPAAAPAGPAARWDDPTTLRHLFNVPDQSPELKTFLAALGKLHTGTDVGKSYRCREKGINVCLSYDRTTDQFRVWGFYLYADGVEQNRQYPAALPHGVTLADTRDRVIAKLGPGRSLRPEGFDVRKFGPRDEYLFDGYRLVFDYTKGTGTEPAMVWVGPPMNRA